MRLALALLLLTACSDKELTWNMIVPGGGGVGMNGSPDAASADGGDGGSTTINGRVCLLLTNQQSLTSCAAAGAGGFTVTLGTNTAMTADDGAFTIMRPASTTGLDYNVTGTGLKTSVVPFSSTITTLPAIKTVDYDDMAMLNSAANDTDGALFVQVKRMGTIVSGAIVASNPQPASIVLYDRATSAAWDASGGGTGSFGVAWLPSIAATSTTVTVTSNAVDTPFANIPLQSNSITYAFAEIP